MKTIDAATYSRDAEKIESSTVSELPRTTELRDGSLLHIAQISTDGSSYDSQAIDARVLKSKIYEAVQNTLKTAYWDTHADGEDLPEPLENASFQKMVEYLGSDAPAAVSEDAVDGFVKHVFMDFDILKRYVVKKDDAIMEAISLLNGEVSDVGCRFERKMAFTTTNSSGEVVNESVNHAKSENDPTCQMQIKPGNRISSQWTCPASGMLVVVGWLDSSAALNNKSIPASYCVLEARIDQTNGDGSDSDQVDSSSSGLVDEGWEIIGAQSVIPGKNLTYVSFNAPVQKGLVLRTRTGFICGAKSSQTSNEQDAYDTLSNATPNGFKCMVYSRPGQQN